MTCEPVGNGWFRLSRTAFFVRYAFNTPSCCHPVKTNRLYRESTHAKTIAETLNAFIDKRMVLGSVREWSPVGTTTRRVGVLCSDRRFTAEVRDAISSVLGIEPTIIGDAEISSVDVLIVAELAPNALCCAVERVRRQGYTMPLLVVTTDDHSAAVGRVFAAGADDYVTLPKRIAELPHRVMAIRRRVSGVWTHEATESSLDTVGVSPESGVPKVEEPPPSSRRGIISSNGVRIVLTQRELSILNYLRSRPRVWVSAPELMLKVCACSTERDSTLVRVHMSSLRKKLGVLAKQLESRRTYGYRWVEPSEEA